MSGMFRMNSPTPFVNKCPNCGRRVLEAELEKNNGLCDLCYEIAKEGDKVR